MGFDPMISTLKGCHVTSCPMLPDMFSYRYSEQYR